MTVPNPSAHVEALRRLIETWRGYAKSDRERMDASETSVGVSFLQGSQSSYEICADGLEAALAPLSGPVDASGEPDRFAPCHSSDPMEHFWTAVLRGWDIEPREYFEREAVPMGFRSPVEMAVHHMWKRHAKDWPAAAAVPSSPAQEPK